MWKGRAFSGFAVPCAVSFELNLTWCMHDALGHAGVQQTCLQQHLLLALFTTAGYVITLWSVM
jgi:hypothetical protein